MRGVLSTIHNILYFVLVTGMLLTGTAGAEEPLETVKGHDCYSYSDKETPEEARRIAKMNALRDALENHKVYIKNKTLIDKLRVKEDFIISLSEGVLQSVEITKDEEHGRKICIDIKAKIDPNSAQDDIERRVSLREQLEDQESFWSANANSDLRLEITINNEDGRYEKGEFLAISVKSNRNGFLKLDYCQADGTVVHLVPNIFSGSAYIEKGEIKEFGGEESTERFVITEPFGDEWITGLLSTEPFPNAMQSNTLVGDCRKYNDGIKIQTRGIQLKLGAAIVTLQTLPVGAGEPDNVLQK